MTQIEDVVLVLRERFGQRLAEVTVSGQETVQPAEGAGCGQCGEAMRYQGRKGIAAESRVGELRLERGYYYCARCRSGFFPLDDQLQLRDPQRSEGVLCQALWLSGLVEYERVEEILARIGGIELSRTSVWRCVQQWGGRMAEVLAAEQAQANQLPAPGEPPLSRDVNTLRRGVSMDGTLVPIRQGAGRS